MHPPAPPLEILSTPTQGALKSLTERIKTQDNYNSILILLLNMHTCPVNSIYRKEVRLKITFDICQLSIVLYARTA